MKVTLETQGGGVDTQADGNPPPAVGGDSAFSARSLPRALRVLLASYVGVGAVVVGWLAAWNATLTRSPWDLTGTALLLVIAITCALAFLAILRDSAAALTTTITSQIFIACLAGYVWLVDESSPDGQLLGVTGVALTLGGVAVVWAFYLGRHARGAVTRGAAVIAALFPLVGVAQFWLQTDYLPQASRPLVDVRAELSVMGSSGPTIHVLAKVTMHNRGSAQVDLHAGLIRVMSYPVGTPTRPPTPDAVAASLDLEGGLDRREYRETPTLPIDSQLLYAKVLAAAESDMALLPGETMDSNAVIDVDSRMVRLVRLTVEATVVTHRSMQNTRPCGSPQVTALRDLRGFVDQAKQLHYWQDLPGRALCTESEFAPRGAIHSLVADHPVSRTFVMVESPKGASERPMMRTLFGTPASVEAPHSNLDEMRKIGDAHPSAAIWASAEYAPADADLPRGG